MDPDLEWYRLACNLCWHEFVELFVRAALTMIHIPFRTQRQRPASREGWRGRLSHSVLHSHHCSHSSPHPTLRLCPLQSL